MQGDSCGPMTSVGRAKKIGHQGGSAQIAWDKQDSSIEEVAEEVKTGAGVQEMGAGGVLRGAGRRS